MGNIKIVADLVFIHEIFSQCYNTFSLVHAYGASTSQASAEFKIICTRTHVDVWGQALRHVDWKAILVNAATPFQLCHHGLAKQI
jgi:hypothetical protein